MAKKKPDVYRSPVRPAVVLPSDEEVKRRENVSHLGDGTCGEPEASTSPKKGGVVTWVEKRAPGIIWISKQIGQAFTHHRSKPRKPSRA